MAMKRLHRRIASRFTRASVVVRQALLCGLFAILLPVEPLGAALHLLGCHHHSHRYCLEHGQIESAEPTASASRNVRSPSSGPSLGAGKASLEHHACALLNGPPPASSLEASVASWERMLRSATILSLFLPQRAAFVSPPLALAPKRSPPQMLG